MSTDDKNWIETATLARDHHGTHLIISARPLHALIAEDLGERLMSATFHVFCCHLPEWAFAIRWGKLDNDGWAEKSLGSRMSAFGNWACLGFGAWKKKRQVARIPVDRDWVLRHYPDADPIFTEDSGDSMRSGPGDRGDVTL